MDLQSDAHRLATEFSLDEASVLRVLRKSRRFGPTYPLTGPDADSLRWLLSPPCFEELCRHIGPDALAVFEKADPWEVRLRRELMMRFVPFCPYPFYTLHELADMTGKLMEFFAAERESLVATGKPSRPFTACAWLDELVTAMPPATDAVPEVRTDLIELRIAVFRTLLAALRERLGKGKWHGKKIGADLWDRCVAIVNGRLAESSGLRGLLQDEVTALLGSGAKGEITPSDASRLHGGLTVLLLVALYCCREIAVGTHDRTREALGPLVRLDERGRPVIDSSAVTPTVALKLPMSTMYTPKGDKVDVPKALNLYRRLIVEEGTFHTCRVAGIGDITVRWAPDCPLPPFERQRVLDGLLRGLSSSRQLGLGEENDSSQSDYGPPIPFPTPDGAEWSDVTIRLESEEKISIRVRKGKEERQWTYHFSHLTFASKSGAELPAIMSWRMLRALLAAKGACEFSEVEWPSKRQHKRVLDRKLRDFLNIRSSAIESDRREHGYRARFVVGTPPSHLASKFAPKKSGSEHGSQSRPERGSQPVPG